MSKSTRIVFLLAAAMLVAASAAVAGGQTLNGVVVGASVNAPIGDFAESAGTGFGISLHWGPGDQEAKWSGRGSFGFDYFSSSGSQYSNTQFTSFGVELLHRSRPTFYQFAGGGQYSTKYALRSATGSQFTTSRYASDFGLTGGVGVNFERGGTKLFAEFAATTVFTGTSNSSWFPVRFGFRF